MNVLRLQTACLFLVLSSCTSSSQTKLEPSITAADAKSALVELMDKTDDADLHRLLDHFEEVEAEYSKEKNTVNFGPWACDLNAKSFSFLFTSHPDVYLEYGGSFLRQSDGKWVAKVELKRQT